MTPPPNLPDLLQARLKLGLFNWGKRTVTWTLALGLLSAAAPGLRFLLIGWLIYSALALGALLLGLKLAKNLKTAPATPFPTGRNEPREVGGTRPDPVAVDDSHPVHTGRAAASDEIIEIEAEVLPPERP